MLTIAAVAAALASVHGFATGNTTKAVLFGIAAAAFALAHHAYRKADGYDNAAERELYAAQTALDTLDCDHDYECPEYLAANQRVIDAERDVSWWRRWFVARGHHCIGCDGTGQVPAQQEESTHEPR